MPVKTVTWCLAMFFKSVSAENFEISEIALRLVKGINPKVPKPAAKEMGGYAFHKTDDIESAVERLAVEYGVTMYFTVTECALSVVQDRSGKNMFSCLLAYF